MSATTLIYTKLIRTNVATSNAVNLAESGIMGHRVQIPMSVDDLNRFFRWERLSGSSYPVGHYLESVGNTPDLFTTILSDSLNKTYIDIDGVTNGLNFSSAILDANPDTRLRFSNAVSANDLCLSYLLYKCYGTSSAPTLNVIYNLDDTHHMLETPVLSSAIHTSLAAEEVLTDASGINKGAIHAMFTDLLSTDPGRFFNAEGKQIPGLFEVNYDFDSSGSWQFVENDKIEMRVQFTFMTAVTRTGVKDPAQRLPSDVNTEDTSSIIIPAGGAFTIRLQITATDTTAGAAAKAAARAQALIDASGVRATALQTAAQNAADALSAANKAVAAALLQKANADAELLRLNQIYRDQQIAVTQAQAAIVAAQLALDAARLGDDASGVAQQEIILKNAQATETRIATILVKAQTDIVNATNAHELALSNLQAVQLAAANAAIVASNAAKAAADAALADASGNV